MIDNSQLIIKLKDYFSEQPVLRVYLFGSYARQTPSTTSDIDLLIVLDPEKPIGMEYVQMYLDIKELTGKEVDLVTDNSLSKYVRPHVEKEKILIYDKAA